MGPATFHGIFSAKVIMLINKAASSVALFTTRETKSAENKVNTEDNTAKRETVSW